MTPGTTYTITIAPIYLWIAAKVLCGLGILWADKRLNKKQRSRASQIRQLIWYSALNPELAALKLPLLLARWLFGGDVAAHQFLPFSLDKYKAQSPIPPPGKKYACNICSDTGIIPTHSIAMKIPCKCLCR